MTSGYCAATWAPAPVAQVLRTNASNSRIGLFAGDGHPLEQDRAALAPAPRKDIAADRHDALEHVAQVAGDGDLLDGKLDLAAVHPVAGDAARVIARDEIDALSHQLGDEQAAAELAQHADEIRSVGFEHQVVVSAGIAGALHAELARGIAA